MSIEFSNKEPIYIQIKRIIESKIVSGELNSGDRLPSVRDYAIELKVNPNTIQRVYSELEGDDLVVTKRGIGKFITEDKNLISNLKREKSLDIIKDFLEKAKILGYSKDQLISLISEMYGEE